MTSSTDLPFEPRRDPRPGDRPWGRAVWPIEPATRLHLGQVGLRLATPGDALGLFTALDHDACWEHVKGRPRSEDDVVQTILDSTRQGRWMWVVEQRGAVVGTTSFIDVVPVDARLEIGSTAYAPSAWGTEVNPTCKLLLMTWAFEFAGMGRVQLKTDVRNARSQEAIARLGAQFEGVLRRYQRRSDDTVRDTVMFSVIAEDWPRVKAGLEARVAEHGDIGADGERHMREHPGEDRSRP